MNTELFFESCGDERATPQSLFDALDAEFHFDIDLAASPLNHKHALWFGEGGIASDALLEDWCGQTGFLNPPYSVAGAFVQKAREEADKGATTVLLLPVRSDTKYWHKFIWDKDAQDWYPGVQCRFLPGRVRFELNLSDKMRELILHEYHSLLTLGLACTDELRASLAKELADQYGLPKMAIQRIWDGLPDEDLLEGAPFPSCVVVMRKS
jgi:phage N-6-adenine-methyltransferase